MQSSYLSDIELKVTPGILAHPYFFFPSLGCLMETIEELMNVERLILRIVKGDQDLYKVSEFPHIFLYP